MFVFIIGFITKNGTWKSWRDNLLAALVIYATFQTIDMILFIIQGNLTLILTFFFLKMVFGFSCYTYLASFFPIVTFIHQTS
ncbi:hypothetical protein I3679_016700 [Proteus mirabilis]|uniref:Uncharacterized protein n=1 Tax=Proteus mirabilis TaxID=584 RepID=A0ABD5LY12_PROMI